MINQTLTHYRITAKLGLGGMGEVYRATDTKLGRDVAIKVLAASFSRDPQSLARFEREAKALASLNHPYIAAIYGFEADQGTHFIVLELVEGETLAERLRRGALPMKEALTVARQMAEAIQEAHEKGIIHRDLKPGNVKITPNGRVKILDFGLAKLNQRDGAVPAGPNHSRAEGNQGSAKASPSRQVDVDAPTHVQPPLPAEATTPGAVMGTPAYMSPEQARGQEVDKRTDVWAFGCCLFECLSGRKPFQGQTASDLIAEVLKSEPDWSQVPTDAPREVVTLLRRCLEKEPGRRLSSMGDIAITLEETTRAPAGSLPVRASPGQGAPRPSSSSTQVGLNWLRPVAVGCFLLVIGVGAFLTMRSGSTRHVEEGFGAGRTNSPPASHGPSSADQKSIAVLPLDNLSPDATDEWFADGMTEELISSLSKISGLTVIARTSVMRYKRAARDLPGIGRELNVGTVLAGSVRKDADQLRISVQLIDVARQVNLWAQDYNREFKDVFAVQSEVGQRVVEALKGRLLEGERQQLTKRSTENLEAYRLYQLGRFQWSQGTHAGLLESIKYFEQALAMDGRYARAYAGLAGTYHLGGGRGFFPLKENVLKAKEAVLKALELAPDSSDAHRELGAIKLLYDWDWAAAGRELETAIALNSNDTEAAFLFSVYLMTKDRKEESVAEARRAVKLDPLDPRSVAMLARRLYEARQYDESIAQGTRAIDMNPSHPGGHHSLGYGLVVKGRYEEAIRHFEEARRLVQRPAMLGSFGYACAVAGRTGEARNALENLKAPSQLERGSAYFVALIFLGLREYDAAFTWLEHAKAGRSPELVALKVDPAFDVVRVDSRFKAFLREIGLDHEPDSPNPVLKKND